MKLDPFSRIEKALGDATIDTIVLTGTFNFGGSSNPIYDGILHLRKTIDIRRGVTIRGEGAEIVGGGALMDLDLNLGTGYAGAFRVLNLGDDRPVIFDNIDFRLWMGEAIFAEACYGGLEVTNCTFTDGIPGTFSKFEGFTFIHAIMAVGSKCRGHFYARNNTYATKQTDLFHLPRLRDRRKGPWPPIPIPIPDPGPYRYDNSGVLLPASKGNDLTGFAPGQRSWHGLERSPFSGGAEENFQPEIELSPASDENFLQPEMSPASDENFLACMQTHFNSIEIVSNVIRSHDDGIEVFLNDGESSSTISVTGNSVNLAKLFGDFGGHIGILCCNNYAGSPPQVEISGNTVSVTGAGIALALSSKTGINVSNNRLFLQADDSGNLPPMGIMLGVNYAPAGLPELGPSLNYSEILGNHFNGQALSGIYTFDGNTDLNLNHPPNPPLKANTSRCNSIEDSDFVDFTPIRVPLARHSGTALYLCAQTYGNSYSFEQFGGCKIEDGSGVNCPDNVCPPGVTCSAP
jgi:hypothetical protein